MASSSLFRSDVCRRYAYVRAALMLANIGWLPAHEPVVLTECCLLSIRQACCRATDAPATMPADINAKM